MFMFLLLPKRAFTTARKKLQTQIPPYFSRQKQQPRKLAAWLWLCFLFLARHPKMGSEHKPTTSFLAFKSLPFHW